MAKETACPACGKKFKTLPTECPQCEAILTIHCLEIRFSDGETKTFEGSKGIDTIKDHLLSGKVKLSSPCRKFIKTLESAADGERQYRIEKEQPWKNLRHYADKEFELRRLYDPTKAYAKHFALIAFIVTWVLVTIGAITVFLIDKGDANPILAFIIAIITILVTGTFIGLPVVSLIVSYIYDLPAMNLALVCLGALLGSLVPSTVFGLPLGYIVGMIVGSNQKKARFPLPPSRSKSTAPVRRQTKNGTAKTALEPVSTAREKARPAPANAPQPAVSTPRNRTIPPAAPAKPGEKSEPRQNGTTAAMAAAKRYRVVLTGISREQNPEEVKRKFARMFKSPPERIDKMLSRIPVIIRSDLTHDMALNYQSHIEKAGGTCKIMQCP